MGSGCLVRLDFRPLPMRSTRAKLPAELPAELMGMLGNIDSLKREIQDRIRRIEAVKQAKSVLAEDAIKTEALNKRLAEMNKVVTAVHSGSLGAEKPFNEDAVLRLASREPVLVVHEGVALGRSRPEVAKAMAIHEPVVALNVDGKDAGTGRSVDRSRELVQEARRLLEESSARLDMAVQREEQAATDLLEIQEATVSAFQSASQQLAEAERQWKLADAAAVESRRLLDGSTAQLTLAVTKEQQSAADFHSAQRALSAAYELASRRLESAEQYRKEGDGFAQETRKLLQRMDAELAEARSSTAAASEDLLSARQELTTAYQFASLAAQRQVDSVHFFRKTVSWVIFSTASAWMLAVWMVWAAFHRTLTISVPFVASCLIVAGAVYLRKRGERELE